MNNTIIHIAVSVEHGLTIISSSKFFNLLSDWRKEILRQDKLDENDIMIRESIISCAESLIDSSWTVDMVLEALGALDNDGIIYGRVSVSTLVAVEYEIKDRFRAVRGGW